MRNAAYFLAAFAVVVVIGILSGCANDPHDRASKGYALVAYCGMERCDGKPNR